MITSTCKQAPKIIEINLDLTDMNFFLIAKKALELWDFQKQQSDMCNNCDRKDWTFDLGKTPGSQIPHEIVIESLPAPIKQIRLDGCLMDPMTPEELEIWKLQEIEQKRFQKRKAAFDHAFKAWLNDPAENEFPDRDEFFD